MHSAWNVVRLDQPRIRVRVRGGFDRGNSAIWGRGQNPSRSGLGSSSVRRWPRATCARRSIGSLFSVASESHHSKRPGRGTR
jgi:hypothetical protein